MIVDKKVFLSTIKAIEDTNKLNSRISANLEELVEGWPFLKNTEMLDNALIELIESLYKNDFYSYFIYEGDFGRGLKEDSVHIDGLPVDITTADKLYGFLESMSYVDKEYRDIKL
jgi:hypothetical protein